jgi:hypothetical protein
MLAPESLAAGFAGGCETAALEAVFEVESAFF